MNQSTEALLKNVSQELKILETARSRYAKQLAPDFSVFNYISTDEMMLSRIIADLLDPNGDHSQGDIFLKLFLSQLSNASIYENLALQQAKICTEAVTFRNDTQRRMDIYLQIPYKSSTNSFGICIENKPYAADQPKQFTDYADEMSQRHTDNQWHIVYLTGYGNDPSNNSVDTALLEKWNQKQRFTSITYPDLTEWLNQCKMACQNERVHSFLNAFNTFITKQFLGIEDMSEPKQIIDIVLKNQDSLQAALTISTYLNNIKSKLMELLSQQLHAECQKRDWEIKDCNLIDSNAYSGFEVKFSKNLENYGVGLEFQKTNYVMPIMGVWINDYLNSDSSLNASIYSALAESLPQRPRSSKNWAFYFELCQPENEMWLKIQNGRLVQELMEHFSKIEQGLKRI